MPITTMSELSLDFLQDIYYAEKHALRAYPKLARAVDSRAVREALQQHREETQGQIERLEQVFEAMGKRPRGKTCQAMNGLLEEADEAISEGEKGPVLDAAIIACAQAMEHYEIARYATMITWAEAQGARDVVGLLRQTLEEEQKTDGLLAELAAAGLHGASQVPEDEAEADEQPRQTATRGRK
jgi:ferritin-like metal-binding protein YciE